MKPICLICCFQRFISVMINVAIDFPFCEKYNFVFHCNFTLNLKIFAHSIELNVWKCHSSKCDKTKGKTKTANPIQFI